MAVTFHQLIGGKVKDRNIIVKVYTNRSNGQKLVTIPKDSNIEDGDFVRIEKVIMM